MLELTASAVLFDMDGTLLDSTAIVEDIWTDFAERFEIDVAELLDYSHGRPTMDSLRRFLPHLRNAELTRLEAELTAEELRRLDGLVTIDGALGLMTELQRLARPMALVTSASAALAKVRMETAGLGLPKVLVSCQDVENGKPDPEGYRQAADRLGVAIEECVVFEDAEAGLRAAIASGAQVIVVGHHESATTVGLHRVPDLTAVTATPTGLRFS